MIVNSSALEFEANCQLDLTLSEEKSVRQVTGRAKRWIESGDDLPTGGRQYVHSVIDSGNLRPIENVEAFGQELDLHILFDRESTGQAEIDVLNRGRVKSVIG